MKNVLAFAAFLLVSLSAGLAQAPVKTDVPPSDITGLYSFIHEGEFVQIEVSDGRVTGLVSRFKDEDLESAEFVDQFFEEAKLDGTKLTFRTKLLDGAAFEFSGVVERGAAKTPNEEGYWIIKGRLIERHSSADGKVTEKVHELTLKSFPEDVEPNATRGEANRGAESKAPARKK